MRKKLGFLVLISIFTFLIISGTLKQSVAETDFDNMEYVFVENKGTPLPADQGMLKVGLVYASPFKGVFSSVLYQGADDSGIMGPTMWGSFMGDGEFKLRNGGPCSIEPNAADKKVIIKIDPKYTWNDGTPVTAKDFAYAYEIIGHGDYTGARYGEEYKNVVGMEEYHRGTMSEENKERLSQAKDFKMPDNLVPAKEISGLKIIDDKTLEVTFKKFGVDILWGGGIPHEPVPYHQLKDIPIAKLAESDAVRLKPLSCGPYYISGIVAGESVEFRANEHYWTGKPHIPMVVMTVINPDKLVESMKAGEYDIYMGAPASKFEEIKDISNYDILKRSDYSYSYIGFKLGKWDGALKKNIYDPNCKMADLKLRSAMELAIDPDLLGREYYSGLRYRGTTIIPTVFKSIHDSSLEPIEYDMEAARKMLDEAGYKDIDGDGFRENIKGEKLTIYMAYMSGDSVAEEMAAYYKQQWNDAGLDVRYTNGRLIEFNNFYDLVESDNPQIDVFFGAWSTGSNPAPYDLYGENAVWNFSRYTNPELEEALKSVASEKALDTEYRLQGYKNIQKLIYDKKPVSILFYRMEILPVNKRVKKYDWRYDDGTLKFESWADLQLTAGEPLKAK